MDQSIAIIRLMAPFTEAASGRGRIAQIERRPQTKHYIKDIMEINFKINGRKSDNRYTTKFKILKTKVEKVKIVAMLKFKTKKWKYLQCWNLSQNSTFKIPKFKAEKVTIVTNPQRYGSEWVVP